MNFSKKLALMVGIAAFAGMTVIGSVQAVELTVYTSVEADNLKRYAKGFNELHPDIKINWTRDSAGIQTAKLLAEKNNPQADVVMGLAATSLMLLKAEGMSHPYAPAGVENSIRDSSTNPTRPIGSGWTHGLPPFASTRSKWRIIIFPCRPPGKI